jgi:hypothetical protein
VPDIRLTIAIASYGHAAALKDGNVRAAQSVQPHSPVSNLRQNVLLLAHE